MARSLLIELLGLLFLFPFQDHKRLIVFFCAEAGAPRTPALQL